MERSDLLTIINGCKTIQSVVDDAYENATIDDFGASVTCLEQAAQDCRILQMQIERALEKSKSGFARSVGIR